MAESTTGWLVVWPAVGAASWPVDDSKTSAVTALESRRRIRPDRPFMIAPNGRADPRLSLFFNSAKFRGLASSAQRSYLYDYRLLFDWLSFNGKHWSEATADDLEDYADARVDDPAGDRVSEGKWNRELAAFTQLYDWMARRKLIDSSPILKEHWSSRSGRSGEAPELRATNVPKASLKWLTPRMWDRWREVGLEGILESGLDDPSFRGRSADRNAAYAELLFGSGLRRTEAATLLVSELPDDDAVGDYVLSQLSNGAAKGNSGRPFLTDAVTRARLKSYREISRSAAVSRAQRNGIYAEDVKRIEIQRVSSGPSHRLSLWAPATGRRWEESLDLIDEATRYRLYVRDSAGSLQPAMLFLSESGLPFRSHSWEGVFRDGNERAARLLGESAPYATPHMARHSFALYMLVAFLYLASEQADVTERERENLKRLIKNPWRTVKDLLGHKEESTTRDIYAAPLKHVELRSLFNNSESRLVALLSAIARSSPLVQDLESDAR